VVPVSSKKLPNWTCHEKGDLEDSGRAAIDERTFELRLGSNGSVELKDPCVSGGSSILKHIKGLILCLIPRMKQCDVSVGWGGKPVYSRISIKTSSSKQRCRVCESDLV
jgi:hypothetical protein